MPGERLLVIDDSKEAREFLVEFLGNHGYTVLTACDGQEGLLRAQHENPDAILIDMRMPEMTGLEVIEALDREGRGIPTVFMTAHGTEDLAIKAFRLGASDYIPKPYEPKVVLDSVERALRKGGLRKDRTEPASPKNKTNQTSKQQVQDFNILNVIAKSLTSQLDLDEVMARVVEAATFVVQADEGSVMLRNEPSGELVLRAAKNTAGKVSRRLCTRVDDPLADRAINSGRPVLLDGKELQRAGRADLALLIVPLHTSDRGSIGALVVANSVSERKFDRRDLHLLSAIADAAVVAIENASKVSDLRMENHRLQAVLRETGEVVLVVDEQSRVLLCNDAARNAFGLDERKIVGRPLQEVIPSQELMLLLSEPDMVSSPSLREVPLANGHTLSACVSAINGIGYAVVMHDITYLKELDHVKSELISSISHDLRTPLTTIQGYVDLLPRAGPLTKQQQDYIISMQRSMSAVTQLVSDLVDVSRIEPGFDLEMVTTDLESIITGAVEESRSEAEDKEQSLQVRLPENLTSIDCFPRRVRQAVSNLVSNAVKYTPPRGQITVDVVETEDHITISVTDNGLGIPAADQPYVFDKFFRVDLPETRDIPGSGLGLSIVKSVVEQHGGRVWLESTPGSGSTFTLLLPKC